MGRKIWIIAKTTLIWYFLYFLSIVKWALLPTKGIGFGYWQVAQSPHGPVPAIFLKLKIIVFFIFTYLLIRYLKKEPKLAVKTSWIWVIFSISFSFYCYYVAKPNQHHLAYKMTKYYIDYGYRNYPKTEDYITFFVTLAITIGVLIYFQFFRNPTNQSKS